MTKTDEISTPRGQTERQGELWKRVWTKVETPLRLIITQLIAWALRKWLG